MNAVKKLTLTLVATALSTVLIIPSVKAAEGVITVDTLRVRTAPSTSSDVLRELDRGDKVDVIEEDGDWYKIKLSNNNEAYVYAEYVKLEENLATNENNNTQSNVQTNTQENKSTGEINLLKNTKIHILPVLFSSEISSVESDTTVNVIERINNWICVEYNGVQGWVFSKGTVADDRSADQSSSETSAPTTKTGYVNVSSAYVRDEASKNGDIITNKNLNDEVTIINEVDGWYEIQLSEGTGYIYADLVSDNKKAVTSRSTVKRSVDNSETKPENYAEEEDNEQSYVEEEKTGDSVTGEASGTAYDLVEYAKEFLGCSYNYGGAGPYSFDCSGFTMYVYGQYGVSLPHGASTQADYGDWVSRNNLQPGDLILFYNRACTSIGHSGIYIGYGEFIHAENYGSGVTITSLGDSYYANRYVEARRLV